MIIEAEEVAANYEERMIEENEIAALLKFTKLKMNGVQQYNYCISRKENIEDFLEARDFTIDIFRRVILNIQLAYEEISKYLIDENHIYLSKETVFLEKSNDSYKVSLCYYPKDMGSVQDQFRELMEYFLKLVPRDNRKMTEIIYNAYDLCLKEDFTIQEIIDNLSNEDEQEITVEKINPYIEEDEEQLDVTSEEYVTQGENLSDFFSDEDNRKSKHNLGDILSSIKDFLNMRIQFKDQEEEYKEDFIVDPDYELEEKTVLLAEVKPSGKLVYDGQNQEDDFLVNKDIFRIGSSKSNDAVLKEKTVSANHAKITRDGEDYYLSDLNSTNLTYLNCHPLNYRTPVKLKIMDRISFANVNYIFM
jgi:hypothetical protein